MNLTRPAQATGRDFGVWAARHFSQKGKFGRQNRKQRPDRTKAYTGVAAHDADGWSAGMNYRTVLDQCYGQRERCDLNSTCLNVTRNARDVEVRAQGDEKKKKKTTPRQYPRKTYSRPENATAFLSNIACPHDIVRLLLPCCYCCCGRCCYYCCCHSHHYYHSRMRKLRLVHRRKRSSSDTVITFAIMWVSISSYYAPFEE